MNVPHSVVERTKAAEGSLSRKQGESPMHALPALTSSCPSCRTPRHASFRRQGTTPGGLMLLWCEFKCFEGTCRGAWVQVYTLVQLLPEPYTLTPHEA